MRYGFFSDLHGDWIALQAALKSLEDTDQIVFLGDAVGGARDLECLTLLRKRGIPAICGNHDLDPSEVERLPEETRQYLSDLPDRYQGPGFLGIHSFFLMDNNYRRFFYIYEPEDGQTLFEGFPDQLFFIGHTHVPSLHECFDGAVSCQRWEESIVVNLKPDRRYICNVGMTRQGVVVYDTDLDRLEIRLFERPFDRIAAARRPPVARKPVEDFKVDVAPPRARPWWKFGRS